MSLNPKPSPTAAASGSEALLRSTGLRVTRAAQTVLELLEHASQPLTHDDVVAAYTTATDPNLVLATLSCR